jgi:hypothetical protein
MSKSIFARALDCTNTDALKRHHVNALRFTYFKHPAIKGVFDALPVKLRTQAWISDALSSDTVTIGTNLRDLNGFKDKKLALAMAPFMSSEWTCATSDWTYSVPNRDFRFNKRVQLTPEMHDQMQRHPSARWLRNNGHDHLIPTSFTLQVLVSAYVKSDSATCRIVVTNITERVVREEVKGIVCD